MTKTYYTIDTEYAPPIDATFEYGLCRIQNNQLAEMEMWSFEVDPDAGYWQAYYGQCSDDYEDEPLWTEVAEFLSENIEEGAIVFHHYGEERRRLERLFERYGSEVHFQIINTSTLVRAFLSDLAQPIGLEERESYSLGRLAERLNIDFEHHKAVEDARALAYIVDEMIRRVGFDALLDARGIYY